MVPLLAAVPGVLSLIAEYGPGLARHLIGPRAGEVADQVSAVVQAVTGKADPAEAADAVARDPQLAMQLRVELARIESAAAAEELRLRLADIADARAQTVELARAGSPIAWGAVVVSIIILVAFGLAVWAVVLREVPLGSRELALLLLGTLGAMATQVANYWLGSSAGSKAKDELVRGVLGAGQR